MKQEINEFKSRFGDMFTNEGLVNIKFFVRPSAPVSLSAFAEEANGIQDAIDAGAYNEVSSIDENLTQIDFNEAFALKSV